MFIPLSKKYAFAALSCLLALSVPLAAPYAYAAETEANSVNPNLPFTNEQLKNNDYILYFVNAGDSTPATVEGIDKFGLLSSLTEQVYGADPVTGHNWGLKNATVTRTNVSDSSSKTGSLRYYSGTQVRNKAITYSFQLPEGDYDLTFGYKNPWSGRNVNMFAEGINLSGDYDIGSYNAEKEVTYNQVHVSDGELNVAIQGPATAALTQYNDPLVNYVIVRQHVTIPLADLEEKITEALGYSADTAYTPYSIAALHAAITAAQQVEQALSASGTDISSLSIQLQIRGSIASLNEAIAELVLYEAYTSFNPGDVWTDTNGAPIQAHGGGILYDEHASKYYWYGEDKTDGYLPARGVHVYSSADLYNWTDEGLALRAIPSMEAFDTDPQFAQLYAGRDDKADILNDIGTNRIIERPKVIYNDATGKYVMWMHTDGPTATSTANYAKAEAGYALSDSPTGPFVYGESFRMDRAPEDAEYNGQPDQPGMARDMTLFKDDDGTAYLIYSSEENLTMYISKLNDTYTDVVGWHRDGNAERDTEYKAVYGEDYVRVFPGAQREAPQVFKYQGKYYMISSGATGWDPNAAKYTVADNLFGEWKSLRFFAPGSTNTFSSQGTAVIPVDPEAGKFIYMGDRWKSSDLADSRYVWLPIEFGNDDEIILNDYEEWDLSALDRMGKITVNTELPEVTIVGQQPGLPSTVSVTKSSGETIDSPVEWNATAASFAKPGAITVTGTLTDLAGKVIHTTVYVVPDTYSYFVHAGGAATNDYVTMTSYMEDVLLNAVTIDQAYDPANGQTWGFVGTGTNSSGSAGDDMYGALRYLKGNSGDDLTYQFDLDNGLYNVYTGLYDPWYQYTNGSRKANIIINGETKTSNYVFTNKKDTLGYTNVQVTDGKLTITVRRVAGAPEPQISWIIVSNAEKTAGQVANSVISIDAPDKDSTALTLPKLQDGFEIAITNSDSDVITLDGTVTPPKTDTTVTLVLTVTRASDGSTAHTREIQVVVPARTATAADVAESITSIDPPARKAKILKLPAVPDGFAIAIKSSDNKVVLTDGTIDPPKLATVVHLVLEITRLSDGTAATVTIEVTIPSRNNGNHTGIEEGKSNENSR
ncbi:family 43 glycosylhydrolase [Paenibacillus sp. NEAU-GSW1]|uniref:family 43 glycosylhydrolase n=1 Tax=Paenibacillus sp. NEAU-GSW1 TaxID=2682486 RepID=UPI0012E19C02|nr:family 43 glycosylhydrolase [Paenibacillus sp. NEAU-GSW1]MUT67606.1 family 43 glycosylhydrolase [Paenibacillus sp. NEAU-GSW1]